MSTDRIDRIVAAGEAETPEFKSTRGTRREATWTVCVMPSQQGYEVLFGVMPDGQMVGQKLGDVDKQAWLTPCSSARSMDYRADRRRTYALGNT